MFIHCILLSAKLNIDTSADQKIATQYNIVDAFASKNECSLLINLFVPVKLWQFISLISTHLSEVKFPAIGVELIL